MLLSTQKQPICKKTSAAFKSLGEKSCEIEGDSHFMLLMLANFNNDSVH